MKKCLFLVLIVILMFDNVYAQRGCCSHHGGVGGCSSSGRTICNDGTYSPTCTCTPIKKTVYGCTNSKAINYNSKADVNDNSCRFKKEIKETNIIKYETEYIEDETMYQGEETIEQKGENGEEVIIKELIVDSYENVIETTKETTKTTKEPKKEIIRKGIKEKIKTESEETTSPGSAVLGIGALSYLGYVFFKKR